MSYISKVKEFHSLFKHPILNSPQIPDKKRCDLRIELIKEELEELKEAVENNDLKEVADALTDLQYVLSGAIIEFGMADLFDTLFNEVHRSNMSKACKSLEEAEQTIAHYKSLYTDCYYEKQADETYLIYRTEDKKTLKSINYSPADISSKLTDSNGDK